MKIMTYRTIIKKDGKYYHGFVPILPGCHTQGKTIEETQKNLKEAIELYLKSLISRGEKIPEDTGLEYMATLDLEKLNSTPNLKYA